MAKFRLDILSATKYLIALMILATIGYCTVTEIEVERQMWAVASSVFTYMFTILVPQVKQYGKRVGDQMGMIARAIISFGFMAIVCWCTITQISIGKEVWALASSIITFIYVSKAEGD